MTTTTFNLHHELKLLIVEALQLEDVDPAWLRRGAVSFEGEDLEARLARRARNWIPRVRFVDAGAAPQ